MSVFDPVDGSEGRLPRAWGCFQLCRFSNERCKFPYRFVFKGLFIKAVNLLQPATVAVKFQIFQLFAVTYPSVTVYATCK